VSGSILRAMAFLHALPLAVAAALALPTLAAAADACRAASGPRAAAVVELYTSQGCSSCPPADAWLSRLQGRPGVVPLAFHVDYWDRLGWKDRLASRANTERQASQRAVNGARYPYTPQVVIDGVDRPDWPSAALGVPRPSPVEIGLVREGDRVVASVAPRAGPPVRLAALWAVAENGHATAVKAGENRGATLGNDAVVRRFETVDAWNAAPGMPRALAFAAPAAAPAARQSIAFVVLDAATGRPLDAVSLGC
jgi:hypothetical protein